MEYNSFMEALKGNQHKIDKNKNGKVDSHDFKLLRKEETEELEEATVKTQKYSWGTMKTVHHGADFSIPLHPEHHQAIAKLKDEQEHKFRDETGRDWTARRKGEDVHFQGANGGSSTKVPHSTMQEAVRVYDVSKSNSGTKPTTPEDRNKAASAVKAARANKPKDNYTGKPVTGAGSAGAGARATGNKAKYIGVKEEVEDLDEIRRMKTKLNSLDNVSHMSVARQKLSNLMKSGKARGALVANKMRTLNMGDDIDQEDLDALYEVMSKDAKAGDYISDFVHSTNPKFEGKSKKERIKMALGAYYDTNKKKDGVSEGYYEKPASSYRRKGDEVRDPTPIAPVPDRKYIKGTPENKALKASRKPINGHPTNEEVEEIEERNKENAMMRKTMDASRGARYKLNNPVPDADPKHKTARDHNVAIGRALRNEDKMTTTKDKNGKLISFKYEGDWKKSDPKKNPEGKVHNLAGQALKKMQQTNEAKDPAEYDQEGDMAKTQLRSIKYHADELHEMLSDNDNLPEWVQSKLTLAQDYLQTVCDYMYSKDEVNEEKKSVEVKVNAAGDAPHEEKWEAVKKIKKPVKESFDDEGNLIPTKISYKDFITEIKLADLPVRRIQGHSYGANYTDPEGADDYDDKKPMKPAAEKRGRGRPAGAKSGARKITGTSKLMNK